ncbi:hypothetical protein GCM10009827_105010 [Dactylosporangium maewongense]|uniref:TauD/TfdA-like domain-containing protein n=1 Tax=Dactylosporangium maewongense TaxID=634393 RepID=A0ABP4NRD0_9ACTN
MLASAALAADGFAVLGPVDGVEHATALLGRLGVLVGQYDGNLTHEVTYRPGNEGRAYSQSVNTIRAHTEAPGWRPSPKYLALYCHRQARCGGGDTDLLDVETLLPRLTDAERTLLTGAELDFPGPAHATGGAGPVRGPMLSGRASEPRVLRFSYNLLTTGEYDPPLDSRPGPARLPLGAAGAVLAARVSELFAEHRLSVLIPEHAVLVWDNRRMLHARSRYTDTQRHLTHFFLNERGVA